MAHVSLPVEKYGLNKVKVKGKTIWQNGKWIGETEGIVPSVEIAGHACFIVEPGIWNFEAT